MSMFPSCPNHGLPMLLKNGRAGTFWYCDTNGCAHTQDFYGRSRRILAVNGRDVAMGSVGTNKRGGGGPGSGVRGHSGSKVEEAVLRKERP